MTKRAARNETADMQGKAEADVAIKRARGRPRIAIESIVIAAIELVEEQGAQALSMRAIAERLGSGTATLYRNFSGRSDLISHIFEHVLSGAPPINDDPGDWQGAIAQHARSMFDVLHRHNHVLILLAGSIPEGPVAMEQRERVVGLLLRADFSPEIAAKAFATISRFVLGFAIQISEQVQKNTSSEHHSTLYQDCISVAAFPALYSVVDYLPLRIEEEFEFGLQLILCGLNGLKVVPGAGNDGF